MNAMQLVDTSVIEMIGTSIQQNKARAEAVQVLSLEDLMGFAETLGKLSTERQWDGRMRAELRLTCCPTESWLCPRGHGRDVKEAMVALLAETHRILGAYGLSINMQR